MARNAKMTVDLEIGDIKQKDIDKLIGDMKGKLSRADFDPGWTDKFANARKELSSLRQEKEKLSEESDKASAKEELISKEISKVKQKITDLEEKRKNLLDKSTEKGFKSLEIQKKFSTLQRKLVTDQEKLNQLSKSGLSDEKTKATIQELSDNITANTFKSKQMIEDLGKDDVKTIQQVADLDKQINASASEHNDLVGRHHEMLDEIEKRNQKIGGLQDEHVKTEHELYNLEVKRNAEQELIANELMKTNKLTKEEAKLRAGKLLPLDVKKSKFELKEQDLYKKSKKFRKEELKDELANLNIMKKSSTLRELGFLDRAKVIREERKNIFQKHKHKPVGESLKDAAAGAPGAVASGALGQLKEIPAVLGKLAGPLMALGSIAGFAMLMISYNEQILEARKNLYKLSATGAASFKDLANGQQTNLDQVESFRKSLYGLYDTVGMTYDEALKGVDALTKAGVDLTIKTEAQRQDYRKFMGEVEEMATISGMSFDQMAGYAGQLKTEFGKSIQEIPDIFVRMRKDASDAGIMTTRFYSTVINAAQGLAIYGTRVNDVSSSFARLTKGVKMPQQEAMKLAEQMMSANDNLTSSQKTMIGMVGDAKSMLASTKNLTAEQKKILHTDYSDQLEAQTRYFEALDPGKQIALRFRALAKAAPNIFKDIDISKPKQLGKVLSLNREKLALIGQQFGFDKKQLMLAEELAAAGTSIADMPKEMSKKQAEESEKALKKQATAQANIISEGTKAIKDILMQRIAKVIDDIYTWLEGKAWPVLKAALSFFTGGKDTGESIDTQERLIQQIKDLTQQQEEAEANIKKYSVAPEGETPQQLQDRTNKLRTAQTKSGIAKEGIGQLQPQVEALKKSRSGGIGGTIKNMIGLGNVKEMTKSANFQMGMIKDKQLSADIDSIQDSQIRKNARELHNDMRNSDDSYMNRLGSGDKDWFKNTFESMAGSGLNDDAKSIFKQAYGFKRGGYTGNAGISSPTGLVHGKEFVFDADSTRKAGASNLNSLMNSIKSGAAGSASMGQFDAGKLIQFLDTQQAAKAGGSSASVTNSVVINVNQRDRQEIEQILYKVLYDQKGREI